MRKLPISQLFFVISLLLLVSLTALSQTPAPTATPKIADDEGVIKVESRLVVIPASVTDANGQPVQGLTKEDFRVVEEGKPQKIDNVGSADAVPLEIALLFDVSASTDAMFKFEQETAAKFLLDVMKPKDRATIFTVGQTPILVQGRDTAEKSVMSVRSIAATKGATAFFDTVSMASTYLRKNAPEGTRRVMVVISDGEDNFSEAVKNVERKIESNIVDDKNDPNYEKTRKVVVQAQDASKRAERARVSKALQDADTVFFSINPAGSSYTLNQISVFGQENMQTFANETGGTAFLPKFAPVDTKDNYQNENNIRKNQQILDRIFSELASELRAQYLIQYYPEGEYANGRFVKLSVTLANPSRGKVRAREGYYVKQ
jgi:VWFA-related protein